MLRSNFNPKGNLCSSLDAYGENPLTQIARVQGLVESFDPDIIIKPNKVIVIDQLRSNPKCVQSYLYHLVAKALSNEDLPEKPSVLVFDGRFLFNKFELLEHFCPASFRPENLGQIQLYRPPTDRMLLLDLDQHLQTNMSLNKHLQLVVIIPNPSALFPDLNARLNKFLASLAIRVRTMLVVDKMTKDLQQAYLSRSPIYQIISIVDHVANQTTEHSGDDNKLCLRVTKHISVVSSRNLVLLKNIYYNPAKLA